MARALRRWGRWHSQKPGKLSRHYEKNPGKIEDCQDLADAIAPLIQHFQQITGIIPQIKLNRPNFPRLGRIPYYLIYERERQEKNKQKSITGIERSPFCNGFSSR
ncbi:MAG: hypothetical protein J7647_32610 [Cyanobacteria bacterium SBLK]|nr:hypothetical protein [Cyanobacteria bacterium SBLK]